jgi:hypothetical protein
MMSTMKTASTPNPLDDDSRRSLAHTFNMKSLTPDQYVRAFGAFVTTSGEYNVFLEWLSLDGLSAILSLPSPSYRCLSVGSGTGTFDSCSARRSAASWPSTLSSLVPFMPKACTR